MNTILGQVDAEEQKCNIYRSIYNFSAMGY